MLQITEERDACEGILCMEPDDRWESDFFTMVLNLEEREESVLFGLS